MDILEVCRFLGLVDQVHHLAGSGVGGRVGDLGRIGVWTELNGLGQGEEAKKQGPDESKEVSKRPSGVGIGHEGVLGKKLGRNGVAITS